LDFASLVAELRAGHPVGCQIQWDGGGAAGGHFNAVVGFGTVHEDVIVRDPLSDYGESTLPYAVFREDYHGGSWTQAYRTK
jgi:hypothetical protein